MTKLAPETTYQIDVAGYTIKGDGARSVTKLAKTLPRLPDSPIVFVQEVKGSEVTLGWRTSVTDVKEYKIRYGRSLTRVQARDGSQMKALRKTMKELPLDRRTSSYTFRGLGMYCFLLLYWSSSLLNVIGKTIIISSHLAHDRP